MQDWIVDLKERSMQPVLANPSKQVMRLLNNANITPLLGRAHRWHVQILSDNDACAVTCIYGSSFQVTALLQASVYRLKALTDSQQCACAFNATII